MSYQNSSMSGYAKLYKKSDNIALKHNYFIDFKYDKDELKIDPDWMVNIEKTMNTHLIRNKIKRSIQHRKLKSGLKFCQFYASSFDQLLVGFGSTHIHETSLNFHPVYGNPYISGSMLKGISRAQAVIDVKSSLALNEELMKNIFYGNLDKLIDFCPITKDDFTISALREVSETEITVNKVVNNKIEGDRTKITLCNEVLELFRNYFQLLWEAKSQNIKESENEQLKKLLPEFWFSRVIFGNQNTLGNIVFYDAFTIINELTLARFTPHNTDYFAKENITPPADYQQPIPLVYLAIPKKSNFFFEISASQNCPNDVFQKAEVWLKSALEKNGVGAKTSSGFGYFGDFKVLDDEEIKSADYEFLPSATKFEIELKEGNPTRVEEAIVLFKKSKLSEKNKEYLVNSLASESFYTNYLEKTEIIKQVSDELDNGCLQNCKENDIKSILKVLEKLAKGKLQAEIKELKRKLFPVELNETEEVKIGVNNLKVIVEELRAGKHEENKNKYCREIVNLLSKKTVKSKFKAKFIAEVNEYCNNIIKG